MDGWMDGWMEGIPFEKKTLLTAGPSEIGNNSWQLYEWKLLMAQGVTANSPSSSSSGRLGINPKTKTQTWATCIDTFYVRLFIHKSFQNNSNLVCLENPIYLQGESLHVSCHMSYGDSLHLVV
jgi:hypothetical protein